MGCLERLTLSHFGHPLRLWRKAPGTSSRPEGTILALHGFTGSGLDFEAVWAEPALADFQWLCPDLPGHGESACPATCDPCRLLPLLLLIDKIRLVHGDDPSLLLLGYSMGGRLALHYLRRASALPCILIGASPGLADKSERKERRLRDAALIETGKTEIGQFCEVWEKQPLIASQSSIPEPLRSRIAKRRRAQSTIGLASSLAGCGTGALPGLWDGLPAMPAFDSIHGDQDSKFAEVSRRMQERNPSVRIWPVEGSGHAVHLEQPRAVADILAHKTRLSKSA